MQTSSDLNLEPTGGNGRNKRRRVALTPHKAEIERWVAQGYSDGWIASALGTSSSSVQSFRSRHDILRRGADTGAGAEDAAQASTQGETHVYEGVLQHGEESGYGLWLDPAVADDPLFERGFAGVSDINVCIEKERIVLTAAEAANTAGTGSVSEEISAEDLRSVQPGLTDFERVAKSTPSSNRETGRLKFFNVDKGFGFIVRDGGEEIFFHRSELKTGAEPEQGDDLSYEVSSNDRGLVAVDVRSGR